MEGINLWCKLIASVSALSAVFMLVIPESSLKKAFNTLVSLILVFALLYPLMGEAEDLFLFSEKIMASDSNAVENGINSYKYSALISAAEFETEKYIEQELFLLGFECDCSVVFDYKDGELIILQVVVDGDVEKETAIKKINEICGKKIKVSFNGD